MWLFILKRISGLLALFLSVLLLPWWLSLFLAAVLLIGLSRFYEALAAGLLFDALYGGGAVGRPFGFQFAATALTAVLLWLLPKIKNQIVVYSKKR